MNNEKNIIKDREAEILVDEKYIPVIKKIKGEFDKLREEVNTSNNSSSESLDIGPRVRTNMPNTIIVPTIKKEEPRENNNYFYHEVPTYTINQNQTSVGGSKAAFAAVLMVMEILALIILVTLVTLVAFYGLS